MRRTIPSLLLPLALAFATAAGADTLLTMKSHTELPAGMGQPSRDSEIKVWVSPDNQRIRRDEATVSLLLLLDKNKMYMIDNQGKAYSEVDLPIDFKKLMPAGNEEMVAEMNKMAKMDVTITPTQETRKVGSWNATKYVVHLKNPSGMTIASDMWMSKQVGIDPTAFAKMQAQMTSLSPGNTEWAKKITQIPGFPVLTESRVATPQGDVKTSQTLVAVDVRPAPAGTYQLPSGYTSAPFGTIGAAGGAGARPRPRPRSAPTAPPTAPAPPPPGR
jgi:hypothetical protein